MSNKTFLRASIVVLTAIVGVGVALYFLPGASAQRSAKSILGKVSKAPKGSTSSNDDSLILLNSATINVKSDEAQAERTSVGSFDGKRMHLVRFQGPIQPAWHKMLTESGLEIIDYIPNYTYLVYGDSNSLASIQSFSRQAAGPIQWDGPFKDEYRISPDIYSSKTENGISRLASDQFQIQLYKDESTNAETLQLINSIATKPIKGQQEIMHYVNLVAGLDESSIVKIASRPDVISIHGYLEPKKLDERQDIILTGNLVANAPVPGNYLSYLAGKGFTQAQFDASNFLVDITDSGVDTADPANPTEFVFRRSGDPTLASRYIYSRLEGTPNAGSTRQGCDGHGNMNASIIMGYVPDGAPFNAAPHSDTSAFRYGLGVAPFVKLGNSVIFDPGTFTSPVYANLQSKAYQDGSRISSNSWGSNTNTYTTDAQSYDALVRDAQPTGSTFATGNQEMVIVFAAGNQGSGPGTVGSPSTGKNVITVGASENVQAFGGADLCGTTDAEANSAADIVAFSGRGPTSDGRIKPDIMLPGTHVSGTVAQASIVSPVSGTGLQLACFNGEGVCGGVGINFFPAGQQWYTASSGTSHSTPAISGYAALIRQDFINRGTTPPSPAMTKAIMMNSASYMNGVGANDTLPSNNQGMGLANFNNYFDIFAQARVLRDETNADRFTASGQQRIITGTVATGAKPFKVTLAWTDAPGSTSGSAFINNLDLEVTIGGNTYKGNVFSGANSATGGTADAKNNVESVFIPAGVTGNYVVKVKATNIAGDGVPGNADALDQDFALVVSNGNEVPLPVISGGATTFTAESCTVNNSPDPGEIVTINFDMGNVGTANTTNMVATLQATGGVTSPSGPQNYGAMTAGGAAVTRPFTFTAGSSCGQTLTATFQLQDGAANLGTVSFPFRVGLPNFISENFDAVTAPALPAGWVASNATGAALWLTSATTPDTAPNALFIDDPTSASDKRLETPSFTIVTGAAQVSFRNNYALESTFDGGVLEVSSPNISGGAYTDITNAAVGGSFASGGYSGTISASTSAINGRQAWTGTSGSYIDTVANLGPNVVGQTIKLRFRMASDSSVGLAGWHVDGFKVLTDYICCGVAGTPIIASSGNATVTAESFTPVNNTPDPGETVTATFPLQNNGTGATASLVATLQNSGGITPVTTSQNYGVVSPGGGAVTRPFTFVANGNCGDTITATLHLQDGVIDLGNLTYTFHLGTTVTNSSFTESFDGVTAPALPAGWTTAVTGVDTAWVTSATTPNSPPNDTFTPDIADIGTTDLVTPSIAIPAGGGQLTFKNLFNMEASSTPTVGYDGMVLDISVDGGAYSDIVTAGGSFVAGGYTRTISGSFQSPIGGRVAWSGLSSGTSAAPSYITTTLNLPAAARGHNVQLRWRVGTDESDIATGTVGVRVDDVAINGVTLVCSSSPAAIRSRADFDADGKTDLSVFRPSNGVWYVSNSNGGFLFQSWGIAEDVLTPGDYDNDGKADLAVFRPSTGQWFVFRSSDSTVSIVGWGIATDIPVAGDYDNDGKTDVAVFRPSTGQWFVIRSSDPVGQYEVFNWGIATDIPVPGDYDGDGRTDKAIFRPSTGQWFVFRSSDSQMQVVTLGLATDRLVPADYDGDNIDDMAVFRPSTGDWIILRSLDSQTQIVNWGIATDVVAPGDFDGDGKDEPAVFRPSTGNWYALKSTGGVMLANWGIAGDRPITTGYVPKPAP